MRYCSCVLGSRHAQKASNVLPHLDLTPWQPAEQGSFQVKTRSRWGDEAPGHSVHWELSSTSNLGLRAFHLIWYLLQICRNIAALSISDTPIWVVLLPPGDEPCERQAGRPSSTAGGSSVSCYWSLMSSWLMSPPASRPWAE